MKKTIDDYTYVQVSTYISISFNNVRKSVEYFQKLYEYKLFNFIFIYFIFIYFFCMHNIL